jgi:hypothetical protein
MIRQTPERKLKLAAANSIGIAVSSVSGRGTVALSYIPKRLSHTSYSIFGNVS